MIDPCVSMYKAPLYDPKLSVNYELDIFAIKDEA
jgi:hypothetical protein